MQSRQSVFFQIKTASHEMRKSFVLAQRDSGEENSDIFS